MNNDRLNFRTPYYLGDKFAGFQYWEFEHGQVKLIGDYWEPWVSKRDELTAKPDEQCTGFSDKNGKLIYDDDIIRWYGTHKIQDYKVVWVNGGWCLKNLRTMTTIAMTGLDASEIIGNIHEQAEQKGTK